MLCGVTPVICLRREEIYIWMQGFGFIESISGAVSSQACKKDKMSWHVRALSGTQEALVFLNTVGARRKPYSIRHIWLNEPVHSHSWNRTNAAPFIFNKYSTVSCVVWVMHPFVWDIIDTHTHILHLRLISWLKNKFREFPRKWQTLKRGSYPLPTPTPTSYSVLQPAPESAEV